MALPDPGSVEHGDFDHAGPVGQALGLTDLPARLGDHGPPGLVLLLAAEDHADPAGDAGGILPQEGDDVQAMAMLQELKGYPLLTGVRGKPPVDLRALTRLLVAVSQLVSDWPELVELDLNPLVAHEHGVGAVDGLVTLR